MGCPWRRPPPPPSPLLLLLLLLALWTAAEGSSVSKRCSISKAFGLLAADCHALQLRQVPASLPSDIEALDLTFNRLRELDTDALQRYSRLQLLYLDDNAVQRLPDEALRALRRLRVLSLRLNSLTQFPHVALQLLPSLQRLDLSENAVDGASVAAALAAAAGVVPQSLEELSVSRCGLSALPLPETHLAGARPPALWSLRALNVSHNPLRPPLRAVEALAPLCGLRQLSLEGDSHKALDFCECAQLKRWATDEGLAVSPPQALVCSGRRGETGAEAECLAAATGAEAARAACVEEAAAAAQRAEAERLWTWGGGAAAAAVAAAVIAGGCFCWRRRRRRRRRTHSAVRALPSSKDEDEDDVPMKMGK